MKITAADIKVPLDVPKAFHDTYIENYLKLTKETGRLMLFAGDQKVEHLNEDFFGDGIHPDDSHPEHLFRIAAGARIGVFAAQLGLIARYAMDYPSVPYLVKLNSKTNIVPTSQAEPFSAQWYDMDQVADFIHNSQLDIPGIGYTVYLGSEYEADILREAAQAVYEAHQYGLISVLWVYPRGTAVKKEKDPKLIAGATGVAACLGTDFAKVNYPKKEGIDSAQAFKEAILAAGRTRVVCAGGDTENVRDFLTRLHDQIHVSGAAGNATGRNVHQRSLDEAIRTCNAIYAVTVEDATVEEAMKVFEAK